MRFCEVVKHIIDYGNFDHPDFEHVDQIIKKCGVDQKKGRRAFFVARDMDTLRELEIIEGGNGEHFNSINPQSLARVTLARKR